MNLHSAQEQVKEFHNKFGHPIRPTIAPLKLEWKRVLARSNWMMEEIQEFRNADDLVAQCDALADLIYFALGTFVEMGVNADTIFTIVHHCNMEKTGGEKRDDGKQLKPSGWRGPEAAIEAYLKAVSSNE